MPNNQILQLGTLDKNRVDDADYVQSWCRGRAAQANVDLSVSRLSVSKRTGMVTAELLPIKVKLTDE